MNRDELCRGKTKAELEAEAQKMKKDVSGIMQAWKGGMGDKIIFAIIGVCALSVLGLLTLVLLGIMGT